MEAGAKLSVASGEDLSKTLEVTTKALVAFDIKADQAEETNGKFHASVINTPLTLDKLGASLNNSASAYKNFIDMSSKSGDELDGYKEKLLAVNVALTGGLAKQGVPASTAGVTQRMMVTKLLAPEKTAKLMIDQQLELNQVFDPDNNNVILSMKRISEIAREDLPRAINLMSTLYTEGKIGFEAMSKLFTIRHSPKILALLTDVNGELDKYTEKITTGRDMTADAELAMQSWDSVIEKLKNSFVELSKPLQDFGQRYIKSSIGWITKLNSSLSSVADNSFWRVIGDASALGGISHLVTSTAVNKANSSLSVANERYEQRYRLLKRNEKAYKNMNVAQQLANKSSMQANALEMKNIGLAQNKILNWTKYIGVVQIGLTAASVIVAGAISHLKNIEDEYLKSADASNAFAKELRDGRNARKEADEEYEKLAKSLNKIMEKSTELSKRQSLLPNLDKDLEGIKVVVTELNKLNLALSQVKEGKIFGGQTNRELGEAGIQKRLDDIKIEKKIIKENMDDIRYGDTKMIYEEGVSVRASGGFNLEGGAQKKLKAEVVSLSETWLNLYREENRLLTQQNNIKVEQIKQVVDYEGALEQLNIVAKKTFGDILKDYSRLNLFEAEQKNVSSFISQLKDIDKAYAGYVDKYSKIAEGKGNIAQKDQVALFKSADFQKAVSEFEKLNEAEDELREKYMRTVKELGKFKSADTSRGEFDFLGIEKERELALKARKDLELGYMSVDKESESAKDLKSQIALIDANLKLLDTAKTKKKVIKEVDSHILNLINKQTKEYKSLNIESSVLLQSQRQLAEYGKMGYDLLTEKAKTTREIYKLNLKNNASEKANLDSKYKANSDVDIAGEDITIMQVRAKLNSKISNDTKEQRAYYTSLLAILEKRNGLDVKNILDKKANAKKVLDYTNSIAKVQKDYQKTLLPSKEAELRYDIELNKELFDKAFLKKDLLGQEKAYTKHLILELELEKQIINTKADQSLITLNETKLAKEKTKYLLQLSGEAFKRGKRDTSSVDNLKDDKEALIIEKQRVEELFEATKKKEDESKINKAILDINKKDFEILKAKMAMLDVEIEKRGEIVSLTLGYVEALSKGETIAFNSGQAIQNTLGSLTKLFSQPILDKQINEVWNKPNWSEDDSNEYDALIAKREGAELTNMDKANMVIGGIGVLDNILKQDAIAKTKNLQFEMSILEMQGQLAMSDEERIEYDKQVLAKQEALIDAQYAQQTGFMGMEGGAGMGVSGALSGATTGMALGGVPGAMIGGALGGLSGIFGADKAKQEAERQKAMLHEQERIRKLTETQNNIMNTQTQYLKDAKDFGISYARDEAEKDYLGEEVGESLRYKSGKNEETLIHRQKPTGNIEEMIEATKMFDELYVKYAEITQGSYEVENVSDGIVKLNAGIDKASYHFTEKELELLKSYEEMLNNTSVWKNFFGSNVEWDKDKKDFIDNGWDARKEYMDILASGVTDVEEQFGDSFTSMLTNAYRRNDGLTVTYLSNMETQYGELATTIGDLYAKNDGRDMTDIFSSENAESWKKSKGKTPLTEENQQIRNIVENMILMDEQQQKVNAGSADLLNTYTLLGGKLSDATADLGEFGDSLRDAMQDALGEKNFLDRFNTLGNKIGDMIRENITKSLLDEKFASDFTKINSMLVDAMSEDTYNMSDIMSISQEVSKFSARAEMDALRLNSALDMLNMTDEIQYQSNSNEIAYEVGSTNSNSYVYNYNNEYNIGNLLGDDTALNSLTDKITAIQRDRSVGIN